MEREELERKIKEKEEEFGRNGIPYGQWQLDNEYRELQERIMFLDNVSMGQDSRSSDDLIYRAAKEREQISEPVEEYDDIIEIENNISEIEKLISQRESELSSEGLAYGDWYLDAKYQDLNNKKNELENQKEQVLAQIENYKEELEEVKRKLKEKEDELERNGIGYGEWQLDEEWVELKNREEELNNLISKRRIKDKPMDGPVPPVEPEPPKTPEPPVEPEPPKTPVPPVETEPPKTPVPPVEPEPPKGPTEPGEPENKEEKTSPIKVTAKKAWKWVKEHKKQILIAIGLTAVAVSMVVAINQLIPALMAAQKASQVSTIASSMVNNANLWHLSAASEQAALHGANTGLSSLITSLTGQSAAFDAAVGSWSIGGSSLSAFAADAASKAAIASAKVAKLSSTALGLGVGGVGLTGIGALISNKNKSEKYNEYNNEIKQIKTKMKDIEEEEDLVNVYPHLYIVIEKIEKDTELSNDERKILLEKASKIATKLSKKQSKFSKRKPIEFEEEDEMILAEEENTRGGR